MMRELFPLMAAAAGTVILMLSAILPFHRWMQREEIVQIAVRHVKLDDSDVRGSVAIPLTCAFLRQGQTLEIRHRLRQWGRSCLGHLFHRTVFLSEKAAESPAAGDLSLPRSCESKPG